jgi:predicted Fe-S protein YdhL (DUF1289 family)
LDGGAQRDVGAQHVTDPAASDDASPCIDVCRLDRGYAYCIGCLRTIDEIKRWRTMTPTQRQAVLDTLPARRAARAAARDP